MDRLLRLHHQERRQLRKPVVFNHQSLRRTRQPDQRQTRLL